jgi:hypothetical protein
MDFPLDLRFKLLAIASQMSLTDRSGRLLWYVKQRALKLKESVSVYADAGQSRALYRMKADRVFDVSAQYHIEDESAAPIGILLRHGIRSLWRAHYELHRASQRLLVIQEERPWIKLLDSLLDAIPIMGMFTGYVLHPAYLVKRVDTDAVVMRVSKQPAFFEGRYQIERVSKLDDDTERLAILGVLMMLLLERQRG